MFSQQSRHSAGMDTLGSLRQEWATEQSNSCNEDYMYWLEVKIALLSGLDAGPSELLDETLTLDQAWRGHPLRALDREANLSRDDVAAVLGNEEVFQRHLAWLEHMCTPAQRACLRPLQAEYVQARAHSLVSVRTEVLAAGHSWSTANVTRYRFALMAGSSAMQHPMYQSSRLWVAGGDAGSGQPSTGPTLIAAPPSVGPTAVAGQPAVATGSTDVSHGAPLAWPPGGVHGTPGSSNRRSGAAARGTGHPASAARGLHFSAAHLVPAPPLTAPEATGGHRFGGRPPRAGALEDPNRRPSAGVRAVNAAADAGASNRQACHASPIDLLATPGSTAIAPVCVNCLVS